MIYSCIPIQVLELSKQKSLAAYISLPFAVNELTSSLLITAAVLPSRRPSPSPSGHLLAPGQAQQHLFFDKDAVPHTLNFGNAPFLRSAWVSCLVSSRLVAFPRKNKRQHWRVRILSLLSGPRALINDMMPSVRLCGAPIISYRDHFVDMPQGCA